MEYVELVKNKNLDELQNCGGVEAIALILNTNIENGIHGDKDDLRKRCQKFGSNTYKKPHLKRLVHFVVECFCDITVLILLASSILSMVFGVLENGPRDGWYDGASNIFLVLVLVLVYAYKKFHHQRQLLELSKMNNNVKFDVVRNGKRKEISVFDLVVGDVVFLRTGDQVPADGLFIDGYSLQVDESSMTGERIPANVNSTDNPFLLSGSDVTHGYCRMLITSVGMVSNAVDSIVQTPMQKRLDKLASFIRKIGYFLAPVLLLVMIIHHFTEKAENRDKYNMLNIFNFVSRVISALTSILIVAVPGGFDLAFKLTLVNSLNHMRANQAIVRKFSACEAMGSTTVICTNKTGTFTSDQMNVTKFWVAHEEIEQDFSQVISGGVLELFHQGAAFNNAGNLHVLEPGLVEPFGSPIDRAILSWAVQDLKMDINKLKQDYVILNVKSFNPQKKKSGVFIRRKTGNNIYMHQKGAAELVLAMCSSYHEPSGDLKSLDETERSHLLQIIQGMAASSLQCLAFAYTEILPGKSLSNEDLSKRDLILLGIIGMKNPCRENVRKSIESCRVSGIGITMITGDSMFTAKAIATDCRILDANNQTDIEKAIQGSELKNYTVEELQDIVDTIRIVARSSPEDKLFMVKCLKQKGHVVALIGDGINDAPAFKEADVSLSVGIQRGKAISDIVILDRGFSSIDTVLLWGRCMYSNIRKYIQFQLSVDISILVVNFVAVVSGNDVPLTTSQLLWIGFIVKRLGVVALAIEQPCEDLMHDPPIARSEPIITNIMWRNLLAQALYQIVIILTLQFHSMSVFKVDKQLCDTLVSNTYVLCQVFSMFNSREMDKGNIFKGIHKNKGLFHNTCLMMFLQVLLVEVPGLSRHTKRLSLKQWGVCVAIASMTWLIGWVVKFVPVPKKPFLSNLENCCIQSLPDPEDLEVLNEMNDLVYHEVCDPETET